MEDLYENFKKVLVDDGLVKSGDVIIAGVSGGPDSMALISMLSKLRLELDIRLLAAHIHHGLRQEADLDADLVRRWCAGNDVEYREQKIDIKEYALNRHLGIEEAGREVRTAFFERIRNQLTAQSDGSAEIRIALAHHQQDQAETIIHNLGRGTGLAGLTGMRINDGKYLRPLLKFKRSSLIKWLETENIEWREDRTNQENIYTRNKIRNLLLPVWQEILGYDPVNAIARAAEHLSEDQSCLDSLAEDAFIKSFSPRSRSLNCGWLRSQPAAVRSRVLRMFYSEYTGSSKDLSSKHLYLMQDALLNGAGPFDLPGGLKVFKQKDHLYLSPSLCSILRTSGSKYSSGSFSKLSQASAELLSEWETALQIPGFTALPDNLGSIEAVMIEYQPDFSYNSEINCFDPEKISGKTVRFRRSGDIIKPVNRIGTRKLKKFMNECKVAADIRNTLPLAADNNNIIWLPGYACGRDYIITNDNPIASGIRLIWHRGSLE